MPEPLDAIVIGMPWEHHHQPRERLNPITVAAIALGLVLRLWRNTFPVREGGTAIILHGLSRHFEHTTQDPYRALFHELREGRNPLELRASEHAAATDARALDAYRSGRAPHPLLPYVDWESCQPAFDQLGAVVVAGCRDHAGRADARPRPDPRNRTGARDGARSRRRHAPGSGSCSARPTSRSRSARPSRYWKRSRSASVGA